MKRVFVVFLTALLAISLLASCAAMQRDKNNAIEFDPMTEAEIEALRGTVVYKTDNFSINGTMMKYLLNKTVSEMNGFYTAELLDTSRPLDEQEFYLTSYELLETYVDDAEKYKTFKGTWYDFFWEIASDKAKETLAACELAKLMGIELTAKEIEKIESSLFSETIKYSYFYGNGFSYQQILPGTSSDGDAFGMTDKFVTYRNDAEGDGSVVYKYEVVGDVSVMDGVTYYPVGGSNGSFVVNGGTITLDPSLNGDDYFTTIFQISIANLYGTGVTEEDIHSVMKLEALAEKCYDAVSEEARRDIKAESARIEAYYEANNNTLYKADYISFMIPNYRDVEYRVGLLKACKTEDEFRAQVLEIMLWDTWSEYYDKTIIELKKDGFGDGRYLDDSHIPDHDTAQASITVARESIINGILGGKDVGELEDYSDTIFDEAVTFIRDSVYVNMSEQYAKLIVDHAKKGDKSDAEAWTFAHDRVAGDMSSFGKPYAEDRDGSTEVRYIVKPRYIDQTPAVSFGQILVAYTSVKEDDELKEAEVIMEQLKSGSLDVERFKAVASEHSDGSKIFYNDVIPGETEEKVNDWLYADGRQVGDLELVKTSQGYCILYFTEVTNLPTWKVEVINALVEEEMSGFMKDTRDGCVITYCGDEVKDNISIVATGVKYTTSVGNVGSFGNGDFAVIVPSGNKIEVKE